MNRTRIITGLLWLLALLLAGWTLAQLPLPAIMQSIRALLWWQWAVWILLNLSIIAVLTARWQVLTVMLKAPVKFIQLLLIRQAGQAVSFITPGPQFGGEPLQLFWLYRHCALPLQKSVLVLTLDRFLELWINFAVLLLAVLLAVMYSESQLIHWGQILGVLAILLIVLTLSGWILLRQPQWLNRKITALARYWQQHPRLSQIDSHWQATGNDLQLAFATARPALLKAVLLSLLGWIGMLAEIRLLLEFVNVEVNLPTFIIVIAAIRLAMLLPLPGGIGTVEAALFWAFQTLQLPASAAIGLIALMRLRDAVVLVGGLGSLRVMAWRSRQLQSPM